MNIFANILWATLNLSVFYVIKAITCCDIFVHETLIYQSFYIKFYNTSNISDDLVREIHIDLQIVIMTLYESTLNGIGVHLKRDFAFVVPVLKQTTSTCHSKLTKYRVSEVRLWQLWLDMIFRCVEQPYVTILSHFTPTSNLVSPIDATYGFSYMAFCIFRVATHKSSQVTHSATYSVFTLEYRSVCALMPYYHAIWIHN